MKHENRGKAELRGTEGSSNNARELSKDKKLLLNLLKDHSTLELNALKVHST